MKQDSFSYEITARCSLEKALKMLSEFSQHSAIHPLIIHVEQAPAPAGVVRRYLITDRLTWGPFTFKIRYRADILRLSQSEIVTEAYQSPKTTVINRTKLTPRGENVQIQVNMTLRAPNLLFGYVFSQAQKAHLEMAGRIKTALESTEA